MLRFKAGFPVEGSRRAGLASSFGKRLNVKDADARMQHDCQNIAQLHVMGGLHHLDAI